MIISYIFNYKSHWYLQRHLHFYYTHTVSNLISLICRCCKIKEHQSFTIDNITDHIKQIKYCTFHIILLTNHIHWWDFKFGYKNIHSTI